MTPLAFYQYPPALVLLLGVDRGKFSSEEHAFNKYYRYLKVAFTRGLLPICVHAHVGGGHFSKYCIFGLICEIIHIVIIPTTYPSLPFSCLDGKVQVALCVFI